MKKTFILGLTAASMFILASCETEPTAEKAPAVVEGIPTTATITLANAPETMAAEAGSPAESAIAEGKLYVFNNADVLESIVDFTTANVGAGKKISFQTTTGMKRLFVCANMAGKYPAFQTIADSPGGATTLKAFKETEITGVTIAGISTDNKFWMTNLEKQPVQVAVTDNSGTNNFTAQVGRAAAKVHLSVAAGVEGNGGTLTSIKFTTMNNPNKMYLMPVYNGTNYTGDQLLTPYYSAAVNKANYVASAQKEVPGETYMSENSTQDIKAGKVSYLLVEGVWTPTLANTKNPNGTAATQPLATGAKFWRIAQYDKDPNAGDAKMTGWANEFYYNDQPAIGQIGTNQKAVDFTGGKCFYSINVQDKAAGGDDQLPLRYTVKRNSYFKVVINSISGSGSNDPGGVIPDPDKPVETQVTMNVTITVQGWNVIDQSAGI